MKQLMPEKIVSGAIRPGLTMIFLIAFFLAWNNMAVVADEETDALRDHVPRPGVFPPKGAGIQMDGDLVISDPINRRGALRNSPRHRWPL